MKQDFDSAEVIDMAGIRSIYLNKFLERKLYGIKPSAQEGTGRGSRRRFTVDDLFGIALVWWLFEAGLRAEVIKRILRDVAGSKKADANSAALKLRMKAAAFFVVRRQTRSENDSQRWPTQGFFIVNEHEISNIIAGAKADSLLVIPLGQLLTHIGQRIEKLT